MAISNLSCYLQIDLKRSFTFFQCLFLAYTWVEKLPEEMAWCAEQCNEQYSKFSPALLWQIAVTFNHLVPCKTAVWMFCFSANSFPHPAFPREKSSGSHKQDSCHPCEQLAVLVLRNHGYEPRSLSGVEVCRKTTVPLGKSKKKTEVS